MYDKQSMKCDICVDSKRTKKICHLAESKTKLLSLIHVDLINLKQNHV